MSGADKSGVVASLERRDFLAAAAGAGAAITALGFAPEAAADERSDPRVALRDPRTVYRNDQRAQPQAWPGLQRNMNPRPDCGESTYRGAGRLAGRRALITGGDSGIGRAVAIAYAREGADVVINHLPQEAPDAAEVLEVIRAEGRRAVSIAGDLRDEGFCGELVERSVRELGGLDILVNNAAFSHAEADILEHPSAVFDQTIKTNLYAPFWLSKAAVPHLPAGGSIIFTSSVAGFAPSDFFLDYSASKAAITALTKALAGQLAKRGIRVNAVAPGAYWTPIQTYAGAPDTIIQTLNAITPLGRIAHPVEIAPLYVLLADAANSYTSGAVWTSNGGTGVG